MESVASYWDPDGKCARLETNAGRLESIRPLDYPDAEMFGNVSAQEWENGAVAIRDAAEDDETIAIAVVEGCKR